VSAGPYVHVPHVVTAVPALIAVIVVVTAWGADLSLPVRGVLVVVGLLAVVQAVALWRHGRRVRGAR